MPLMLLRIPVARFFDVVLQLFHLDKDVLEFDRDGTHDLGSSVVALGSVLAFNPIFER